MTDSPKSGNWLSKLVRNSQSNSKSPPEAGTDSRDKRREQVRRAQRTHRDRKANYVRALEVEVTRLRSRDVAQEMKIREFEDIVGRLRELLFLNGIQIPDDSNTAEHFSPDVNIEIYGVDQSQYIRATMPNTGPSATLMVSPQSSVAAKATDEGSSTLQSPESVLHSTTSKTLVPNSLGPSTHPYDLHKTQVGVNFVLTLEQPCLLHHDPTVPHPILEEGGTGHTLMLQAPIMARSPQIASESGNVTVGTTWNVPAIELERLLQYSEGLSLQGEVTPVQAWQRICTHQNFALLTPGQLDAIAAALAVEVKCYGFGAVIDERYFNQVLDQTFPTSPRYT